MKSLDATFPMSFVQNLIFLVFTNYTFSRSCSSTEVNSRSHVIFSVFVNGYIFLLILSVLSSEPKNTMLSAVFLYSTPCMSFHHSNFCF